MGIDLKVMASYFREKKGELLPTAVLRFERDRRLFSRLTEEAVACLVRPLPDGLRVGCHEDEGLTFTDVDRSGRRLTFTTPADLRRIELPDDIALWNHAILSFLLALPNDARVVLFWC